MFTISFNCRTNWVKKYGNMLIWACIQMTCNISLSVHTVQEFKQYRQITPSYFHVLRVPVYTAIVLLMFMLSFFFFYKVQNVCGIFKWKRKCADFFFINCVQLSSWESINWFNSVTILYLSQARTWIFFLRHFSWCFFFCSASAAKMRCYCSFCWYC